MVYHLWVMDAKRQTMSIHMNGEGPRIWNHHQGPRGWAERNKEPGTCRSFQCDCVTPCVGKPKKERDVMLDIEIGDE